MSYKAEKKNELVGNLVAAHQRLMEDLERVFKKCTPTEKRNIECKMNEIKYATHRLKTCAAV